MKEEQDKIVCGRFTISKYPSTGANDPISLKNSIWIETDQGEGVSIEVEKLFKWAM